MGVVQKDNNNRQPWINYSARAMTSCVNHLCCTLFVGGVLLDNQTVLTEAIAVTLLRCSYVAVFVRKGHRGGV